MNTPNIETAVAALPILATKIPLLNPRDQRFASDIIGYHSRKQTLTPGYAPWVGTLIARADSNDATVDTEKAVTIGDIGLLKALFDKAAVHLKAPAVVMHVEDVGTVRVFVGRQRSKYEGRTMVELESRWPAPWVVYGEMTKDGQFAPRAKAVIPPTLIPTLIDFAKDPVKHARAYGKLTGKCCFCRLPLDDPRSTAQGYGPVCAKKWHLPWGEKPEAESLFLAVDNVLPSGPAPDLSGLLEGCDDE